MHMGVGKHIPRITSYCYLGIGFANNGLWDGHVQKLINSGKWKLDRLHVTSTVAKFLFVFFSILSYFGIIRIMVVKCVNIVMKCVLVMKGTQLPLQLEATKKMNGYSSRTCNGWRI